MIEHRNSNQQDDQITRLENVHIDPGYGNQASNKYHPDHFPQYPPVKPITQEQARALLLAGIHGTPEA